MRSRLSHELERAQDYNHFHLDSVSEDELSAAMEIDVAFIAKPDVCVYADAFSARLRADAGDDEPVLRLIDVYCEGVTERREVCRIARMKPATYHNAHRRLKRLVENLPEQLRTAAIAAMA